MIEEKEKKSTLEDAHLHKQVRDLEKHNRLIAFEKIAAVAMIVVVVTIVASVFFQQRGEVLKGDVTQTQEEDLGSVLSGLLGQLTEQLGEEDVSGETMHQAAEEEDQYLEITTTSISEAEVGKEYSVKLEAIGGESPYKWSVRKGVLPKGLAIDASTGIISGTPGGDFFGQITFAVTDSAKPSEVKREMRYNFKVSPAGTGSSGCPSEVSERICEAYNDIKAEGRTLNLFELDAALRFYGEKGQF